VSRLIHKESNRALALLEEFGKMNVKVEVKGDYMLITGGKVKGARVSSHNDHRIAMAIAVAGLRADGNIIIENPQCVTKSYPDFFDDIKALGAVLMFS
jgi:3-phosphoshikimate 1-carboxyvinyltransferase